MSIITFIKNNLKLISKRVNENNNRKNLELYIKNLKNH